MATNDAVNNDIDKKLQTLLVVTMKFFALTFMVFRTKLYIQKMPKSI